jgi:hypothetical protein
MNPETQAKNGFKTFIVTLSVSLVVFSALYYVVNDVSGNVDIEDYQAIEKKAVAFEVEKEVKGAKTESAFGLLANTTPLEEPQVLAGTDDATTTTDTTTATTTTTTTATTDETVESTVPETGSATLMGTLVSVGLFSVALYFILVGPRKFALASFEDRAANQ